MNLVKSIIFFSICLMLNTKVSAQEILNADLNEAMVNGETEFYQELLMNIRFPSEARKNGIMGLSIFSFNVNCKSEITDLKFKSTLNYGIEDEIRNQLNTLKFNWKPCGQRIDSVKILVKVAFSMNSQYHPKEADVVVNAMGNFPVIPDKQLMDDLNIALKRNKTEEAKKHLKLLLLRYPYDDEYLKLEQQLNQE